MTLLSTLGRHVGFSFDTGAIAKAVAVLRQRRGGSVFDEHLVVMLGQIADQALQRVDDFVTAKAANQADRLEGLRWVTRATGMGA